MFYIVQNKIASWYIYKFGDLSKSNGVLIKKNTKLKQLSYDKINRILYKLLQQNKTQQLE